eukprot:g401.t1
MNEISEVVSGIRNSARTLQRRASSGILSVGSSLPNTPRSLSGTPRSGTAIRTPSNMAIIDDKSTKRRLETPAKLDDPVLRELYQNMLGVESNFLALHAEIRNFVAAVRYLCGVTINISTLVFESCGGDDSALGFTVRQFRQGAQQLEGTAAAQMIEDLHNLVAEPMNFHLENFAETKRRVREFIKMKEKFIQRRNSLMNVRIGTSRHARAQSDMKRIAETLHVVSTRLITDMSTLFQHRFDIVSGPFQHFQRVQSRFFLNFSNMLSQTNIKSSATDVESHAKDENMKLYEKPVIPDRPVKRRTAAGEPALVALPTAAELEERRKKNKKARKAAQAAMGSFGPAPVLPGGISGDSKKSVSKKEEINRNGVENRPGFDSDGFPLGDEDESIEDFADDPTTATEHGGMELCQVDGKWVLKMRRKKKKKNKKKKKKKKARKEERKDGFDTGPDFEVAWPGGDSPTSKENAELGNGKVEKEEGKGSTPTVTTPSAPSSPAPPPVPPLPQKSVRAKIRAESREYYKMASSPEATPIDALDKIEDLRKEVEALEKSEWSTMPEMTTAQREASKAKCDDDDEEEDEWEESTFRNMPQVKLKSPGTIAKEEKLRDNELGKFKLVGPGKKKEKKKGKKKSRINEESEKVNQEGEKNQTLMKEKENEEAVVKEELSKKAKEELSKKAKEELSENTQEGLSEKANKEDGEKPTEVSKKATEIEGEKPTEVSIKATETEGENPTEVSKKATETEGLPRSDGSSNDIKKKKKKKKKKRKKYKKFDSSKDKVVLL